MQTTSIPWATHTWNPIRGCSPVSEGCQHCYAAAFASRFSGSGLPYEGLAKGGKWTGTIATVSKELDAPKRLRMAARIFVNSMSDLFHAAVPVEYIGLVFCVMRSCPTHTFIVLTKRPLRALEIPELAWPPNLWLGVSVESQKHIDRIDTLLTIPCARRMVSFEPLLGRIQLTAQQLYGVDWVICGRETGPKARSFDEDWARQLEYMCSQTDTPFFYKHGSQTPALDGARWTQIPELT